MAVTSENVEEYISEVLDAIIGKGAALQAKAFREGFSKVFPIADLKAFTADELVMLFGNSDEDWSIESEWCTVHLRDSSTDGSRFFSSFGSGQGRPWLQRRKPCDS